jgi:hypothetical protein
VSPLTLVPLATMQAQLDRPFVLGDTPAGTRMIVEVVDGSLTGDRVSGRMKGRAAADWVTIGPDGTVSIDVRALVETDDGALVFVHYTGRAAAVGAPVYATPRFETGDERYRWLNRVQAVGRGDLDGAVLTYELFELR